MTTINPLDELFERYLAHHHRRAIAVSSPVVRGEIRFTICRGLFSSSWYQTRSADGFRSPQVDVAHALTERRTARCKSPGVGVSFDALLAALNRASQRDILKFLLTGPTPFASVSALTYLIQLRGSVSRRRPLGRH